MVDWSWRQNVSRSLYETPVVWSITPIKLFLKTKVHETLSWRLEIHPVVYWRTVLTGGRWRRNRGWTTRLWKKIHTSLFTIGNLKTIWCNMVLSLHFRWWPVFTEYSTVEMWLYTLKKNKQKAHSVFFSRLHCQSLLSNRTKRTVKLFTSSLPLQTWIRSNLRKSDWKNINFNVWHLRMLGWFCQS